MSLLSAKVQAAVSAGHSVAIASQFCFDAKILVRWLARTRKAVAAAVDAAIAEGAPEPAPPRYFVGVPGPTKPSKLRRIAEICEVPSLFLGTRVQQLSAPTHLLEFLNVPTFYPHKLGARMMKQQPFI